MDDSAPLRPQASQDTLISLVQLDPSPIDTPQTETPDQENEVHDNIDGDTLAESIATNTTLQSRSTGTSAVGLGASGGHGPIFYLTRTQRYSSYAFSVFTALHLATTSIIPLIARSVPDSDSYLLQAREIYQTPLSEPLLIGLPLIAHVGSGIALRLLRRSYTLKRYGGSTPHVTALRHAKGHNTNAGHVPSAWPHLSYISASGYAFTVFLAAHAFVNRGLPLAVEGDSSNVGLSFVAHGFARHPFVSWVSFTGLLVVGCGHMVWGWAKWLGIAQQAGWKVERPTGNAVVDRKKRKQRRRLFFILHGVSAAVTALWAAGGLGVVARGGLHPGWVGKLYDDLFAKIPLVRL